MRRRDFIVGLGTAGALPLAAHTQQTMPVVGYLRSAAARDSAHLEAALRRGLNEADFIEGQNVAVEYHHADNPDRLSALIADLIRRPVNVIVGNALASIAAKAATTTIPIVFATGVDPVSDGLVTSLNRPGGNVTGVHFFVAVLGAKRLELLHQLVPKAATIAVLVHRDSPQAKRERSDLPPAAKAIGLRLLILDVVSERDIETAFATAVQSGAGALLVGAGGFLNSHRDWLAALAARHKLPASFAVREGVIAGGLMSYGASNTDAWRQVGVYVGRILKGAKPADLPVVQSTKFEFVLNLKTAKSLGLKIPDQVLALADEVIE